MDVSNINQNKLIGLIYLISKNYPSAYQDNDFCGCIFLDKNF